MTPHSYFPQFAYKGTQLTLYEAPAPQGAPCVCTLPCHLFPPVRVDTRETTVT